MGFKVAQARLSQKKPLQWEIGAGLLLEGTDTLAQCSAINYSRLFRWRSGGRRRAWLRGGRARRGPSDGVVRGWALGWRDRYGGWLRSNIFGDVERRSGFALEAEQVQVFLQTGADRSASVIAQSSFEESNGLAAITLRGERLRFDLNGGTEGDGQVRFGIQGAVL